MEKKESNFNNQEGFSEEKRFEKKEPENTPYELILLNKEYLKEHPRVMDDLVVCYRDVFSEEPWGEYLRCPYCFRKISKKEVFGDQSSKPLDQLEKDEILETQNCPDCGGRVEFWHSPEAIKAMIESFLGEEVNENIKDLSEEEQKKRYKYSCAVVLKERKENGEKRIVGFAIGITRFKDRVLEELLHHVRTVSMAGEDLTGKEALWRSKEEGELEQLQIIKAINENNEVPDYDEIKNLMYIADFGLLPKARHPRAVRDLAREFFNNFTQKLKQNGIECNDVLHWTARGSNMYYILMGLGAKEVYSFASEDLVVLWNDLERIKQLLEESPQKIGREIIKKARQMRK